MLFTIGEQSVYSGILREVTTLEKTVFKTWEVSSSIWAICHCQLLFFAYNSENIFSL